MQMAAKLREGALERRKRWLRRTRRLRMTICVWWDVSVQELNDTFARTETDDFMTMLGHGLREVSRLWLAGSDPRLRGSIGSQRIPAQRW